MAIVSLLTSAAKLSLVTAGCRPREKRCESVRLAAGASRIRTLRPGWERALHIAYWTKPSPIGFSSSTCP